MRLTTTFYVGQHSKQSGIEFHGDTGSLHLDSWQYFDSPVEIAEFGGAYRAGRPDLDAVPRHRLGSRGRRAGDAIRDGRPHRARADHAAHVIEILDAIAPSTEDGRPVEIESAFVPLTAPTSGS